MNEETGVVTIDHDEIRDWVEDRGGRPALALESATNEAPLRIDFGTSTEGLRSVSWEEFFKRFEAGDLAFMYDPDASDAASGTICSFVDRMEHMDRIENGGEKDVEDEEFNDELENIDEEEV